MHFILNTPAGGQQTFHMCVAIPSLLGNKAINFTKIGGKFRRENLMFKREKMSLQIVISSWPKSDFFFNEKLLNFMDVHWRIQVFLVPSFDNINLFNSIRNFDGQCLIDNLIHPMFWSFGFWYFGHFSCVIFFPVFRLAHLAFQNVNKDYVLFS